MERGGSSSGVVVARVEVEKDKHEMIDIPSQLALAQMRLVSGAALEVTAAAHWG